MSQVLQLPYVRCYADWLCGFPAPHQGDPLQNEIPRFLQSSHPTATVSTQNPAVNVSHCVATLLEVEKTPTTGDPKSSGGTLVQQSMASPTTMLSLLVNSVGTDSSGVSPHSSCNRSSGSSDPSNWRRRAAERDCLEELDDALKQFVQYYNHQRYHESLNNLTPADVYYGRGDAILKERERIKQMTLSKRKKRYFLQKLTPIT